MSVNGGLNDFLNIRCTEEAKDRISKCAVPGGSLPRNRVFLNLGGLCYIATRSWESDVCVLRG